MNTSTINKIGSENKKYIIDDKNKAADNLKVKKSDYKMKN